ncbi:metal ABC transporter permease [uncultured Corynebacterium sp.]|uniref:metal ABC transporter permease n=1 Tax=uncultured Corynebacterium sp. TaxID=159447 RepID=UPI0025F288AD|nr:metal ABC transporter permease [uncultured Corynebacterium sp.]
MTDLATLLALADAPYFRRAAGLLLCVALCGAVVSVIVNLRQMEFSAETLVHSVFPGIVIGLAVAGLPGILPGAGVAAAITIVMFARMTSGKDSADESGTAVVLTSMYGLGVLISLAIGDRSGQLEALMFGRLLDVTSERVIPAAALCLAAALLVAVTWKDQILVAFDREAARVSGVRVGLIDLAANTAVGLLVVAASSAVGVLLVLGFIVIPGLTGRIAARTTGGMLAWALAGAAVSVAVGLYLMLAITSHAVSPQGVVSLTLALTVPLAGLGRLRWAS